MTSLTRVACAAPVTGVLVAFVACRGAGDCILIGCSSGAQIAAHLAESPEALAGATLTECVNGQCWSGVYSGPAADAGPYGDPNSVTLESPDAIPLLATVSAERTGTLIFLDWFVSPRQLVDAVDAEATPTELHDGDHYEIKVVRSDGQTTIDRTADLSYKQSVLRSTEECPYNCKRAYVTIWQ